MPNALTYMRYLRNAGYEATHALNGKQALDNLKKHVSDVVLLDVRLPDVDGIELLKQLKEMGIADRVVIMTAHGSINLAVEAMNLGAYDFLTKPFSEQRLATTIGNLVKHLHTSTILEELKSESRAQTPVGKFIGSSAAMTTLYRDLRSVAPSNATVLITGESGTGKELCADALHSLGARADKPFVPLNCSAVPKELFESELFGHEKGAFTGATEARAGAAKRADGGVLFLDEICELDLPLQAKLLRFVQSLEVMSVGGSKAEYIDIRIVAATNRNPKLEVLEGRFREDLYYRLNVVPIHLYPLRDRERDVLEIANWLLKDLNRQENKKFEGFTSETEALMLKYDWPGNVRELEHSLRRAVVMNEGTMIEAEMLAPILTNQQKDHGGLPSDSLFPEHPRLTLKPLREIELDYIREALRVNHQVVPKAAAQLEISPSTIYRRLKELRTEESPSVSGGQ